MSGKKRAKKIYKRGDEIVEFKKNLDERSQKRQKDERDKRMELLRKDDPEYVNELVMQKNNHQKNIIEDIKKSVLDTFGINVDKDKDESN